MSIKMTGQELLDLATDSPGSIDPEESYHVVMADPTEPDGQAIGEVVMAGRYQVTVLSIPQLRGGIWKQDVQLPDGRTRAVAVADLSAVPTFSVLEIDVDPAIADRIMKLLLDGSTVPGIEAVRLQGATPPTPTPVSR